MAAVGVMTFRGTICFGLALAATAVAAAEPVPVAVPSGQSVSLAEILLDETPGALWARFRFLAPDIQRGQDASEDMAHLCRAVALPYVAHHDIPADRVVISLSDRPVTFGKKDPDAVQFFETYRIESGRCQWEGF